MELYCWCCGSSDVVFRDDYDKCHCGDCSYDGDSRSTCYKCEAKAASLTADLARMTGELGEARDNSATNWANWRKAVVALEAEREKNAALIDKDKRWEKIAADLNTRANENERALYAERARAKAIQTMCEEEIKNGCWSEDDYFAHKVLRALSPSPAKDIRTEAITSMAAEPVCSPLTEPSACLPSASESAPPPAVEKPCDHEWDSLLQMGVVVGRRCEMCGVCEWNDSKPAVAPVESLTEDEGECGECNGTGYVFSHTADFGQGPEGFDKPCPKCAPGEGGR